MELALWVLELWLDKRIYIAPRNEGRVRVSDFALGERQHDMSHIASELGTECLWVL